MSTYSPSLRIELITTGDQAGTWGNTTNSNLGTLIESAIAGYTSVSITSANQALTALNGVADQSRNQTIALTTTTTAAFNVYAPPAEKTYVIRNASAYTATIYNSTVLGNTTAAGSGVAIPAGKTVTVWSDGTDFRFQNNHLSSLTLATDLAVADGGTGASTAADARTNLGLGTMATQASSSVAITGGSITGITDLAVADGGTGASTAAGARSNLGAAASGANSDITSLSGLTTALSVAQGGTGGTTSTGSGAVVLATAPSIASPTLTGTPVAPTASQGTNTTQVATTAFVLSNGAPTGGLMMWATSSAPSGWLLCNGSAVSRSTYSALFAVVGTAFGSGDGSTTFNLPDYRDRMPIGAGTTYSANSTGGSKDAIVVSHTHTASVTDPGHNHLTSSTYNVALRYSSGAGSEAGTDTTAGQPDLRSYSTIVSATTGVTVSNSTTGSSGTNANLPPYLGIYFIIKT